MKRLNSEYFEKYRDSEMLYNKIDYTNFNIDKFNGKYSIVELLYTPNEDDDKKYIDFESEIFGELNKEGDFLSVSFAGGRRVYLLMYKDNNFDWSDFLEREEYEKFSKKNIYISELTKNNEDEKWKLDIAYNLLLNALPGDSEKLNKLKEKVFNINGKLYVYAKKIGQQIITMNYFVRDGLFIREQQSFVPEKHGKNKENKRYIMADGDNDTVIIQRKYGKNNIINGKKGKLYVKGSFGKKDIKYDHLYLNEKKDISKVELLHNLIEDFNYKYNKFDEIAKLEFIKLPVKIMDIDNLLKIESEKLEDFKEIGKINLLIADDVKIENSKINEIVELIKTDGISVELSDEFDKKGKNMIIIHDKSYYEDSDTEDIKLEFPRDAVTQAITIENLNKKELKNIIRKSLSEIVIKDGLNKRRIKKWKFGDVEFYLGIRNKTELGEIPKHILMKIKSDGSFYIIEDGEQIGIKYTKYINSEEFKKKNGEYKDGNVCIVCKNGNINQIVHTNYIPILDKETKEKHIKESKDAKIKTRTRNKVYKHNKLAFPYIGKSVMVIDNAIHYTVGLDDNPKISTPTINNIYKIKQLLNYEDEESKLIPEILDMLKYEHIRENSTESVRPFPFKYMMEYIRINNPGKNIYLR